MEIYVARGGRETGPFSPEQVQPMVDSGMLALTDSLWHRDLPGWVPVYQHLGLRPPIPGAAGSAPVVVSPPVSHSGEFASFGRRLGAALIDSLIWVMVTSLVAGLLLEVLFGEHVADVSGRTANRIAWTVGVVVAWLYSAVMESSAGRATVGKMVFGLVVANRDGEAIHFWQASRRLMGKAMVGATLGLGFLPCAWSQWKQGLHDMISNTIVVRK